MSLPIPVIVNPVAGKGMARRIAVQVSARLAALGLPFQLVETCFPGHASELSHSAMLSGAQAVFCIGGDGTVLETAQGIVTSSCSLGVIPGGTGNDFARSLGLPHDPMSALEQQLPQLAAGGRLVDAGRVNDQWFLNIAGTGFDADTAQRTLRFKRMARGMAAYLMGVVSAIFNYQPVKLTLTVDGQTKETEVLLVDVCNGRHFGGGMTIAPGAQVSDGLFDLVVIRPVARWRIIFLLPGFIKGNHIRLPEVDVLRCSEVRMEGPKALLLNVDGELRTAAMAHMQLVPGALSVLAP